MAYELKKNGLPKKNNVISNIRCIVLGVLNHFQVNSNILSILQSRFETYIDALLEAKVLLREKGSTSYEIERLVVFDENKVDEYRKNSFYKFIKKRIIPFFRCANIAEDLVK